MPGDAQGVSVPLSLFGGLVTELSAPDLPEGVSPDNQDVVFLPGSVSSRPGLHKVYSSAISGNVTVVYQKTYVQPNGQPINLILDSAGNLWKEDVVNAPGTLTSLGNVPAGSYAQSCSAFGREYIAVSDGVHGSGVPLQYDGTFLDRVTQDGPGAPPTLVNYQPPSATIQGAGVPVTVNIVASPNGINEGEFTLIGKQIWLTSILVVTSTPHGLSVGDSVTISGSTSTPNINGTRTVSVVDSSSSFEIAWSIPASSFVAGGNGTVGTATSSGNSLIRQSNIVFATTAAAHGFQVGWQVQISGVANTNIGGGISAISRDGNGVVTVTTTTAHGLPTGATIAITGVTSPDTSYNGIFQVNDVLSSTQFQYSQAGTVTGGAGTGNVQDIWNTTAYVQSIPTTTSFTYQQLGANDTTTGSGTATILGQVSPGTHQCVVMFLTRQGYLTAPSQPVTIVANGSQQFALSNLPLGPANVVARVLGFTGAGGANYFTLLTTPLAAGQIVGSSLVINDNTSTSAIVDFADNTLFGGTGIDIPGRNQFAQVVLGPCAGFFSYAARMFSWGEYNKVQNLINMGFDGGTFAGATVPLGWTTGRTNTFSGPPTTGTNGGGGNPAWTSPGNITSATTYASVALAALGSSQELLAEGFGFSVPVGLFFDTVQQVNVTCQGYITGAGSGAVKIAAQLLQAGTPVGTSQVAVIDPGATSGSPSLLTFNFTLPPLAATDLNNASFGVQFLATEFEVSHTASAFLRNAQLSAVLQGTSPNGTLTIVNTTIAGFAVQMTSANDAQDCLIQQPANVDVNGIAIILPDTAYTARMQVNVPSGTSGSLVVDLYSPTLGQIASATTNLALVSAGTHFIQQAFNATTPATIPADIVLRVYLSSVTNGKVITVDEVEIIYSTKPYLDNTARASYVNGPEQFDVVTGTIGPQTDRSPLRCFFEFRDVMYMDTARGRHETIDNATGEPSTWSVRELSQSVGALSLKSSDTGILGTGDSAEQFEFTASRGGAYIFWGGEMIKVSQEIQNIWDTINFNAKQTVWIKNDPVVRRCYFGVPLGATTAPNTVLVLDYRELNTPEAIASTAPFRQSYSGKMIATELSRKWTKWNIASNSAEILTLPNNVQTVTFGSGNGQTPGTANGFGNIYYLDSTKLTDDDYGQIVPYWTTYFFVSDDQAQALQLDSHRKLATYLALFISGTGQTSITPLSDVLSNAYPQLVAYPLSPTQNHDLEWPINVDGECIAIKVGSIPATGQTDNQFTLQKMVLTLKKHPWTPLRGAI